MVSALLTNAFGEEGRGAFRGCHARARLRCIAVQNAVSCLHLVPKWSDHQWGAVLMRLLKMKGLNVGDAE
eukprot:8056803-Alexandrium_andersonii.AAC.1